MHFAIGKKRFVFLQEQGCSSQDLDWSTVSEVLIRKGLGEVVGALKTDNGGLLTYATPMCLIMCIAFVEKLLISMWNGCDGIRPTRPFAADVIR